MVSKVSDITVHDIAEYLRLGDLSESEANQLETFLMGAKSYCASYTGIPIIAESGEESLDDFPDIVIAVYVLVQDMYDNRTMYVDSNNINRVVQTILDMHMRNGL